MKKSLVIILFLTLSPAGFAQQNVIVNTTTELVETAKSETLETKKANTSDRFRARVLKINRKKNNEIISIKAYRKSLQIKVKTKRLC